MRRLANRSTSCCSVPATRAPSTRLAAARPWASCCPTTCMSTRARSTSVGRNDIQRAHPTGEAVGGGDVEDACGGAAAEDLPENVEVEERLAEIAGERLARLLLENQHVAGLHEDAL